MNQEFIRILAEINTHLTELEHKNMERDYPIFWERIHAISCAQIGRMLAEIRQVDPNQAALACALHDCGRWVSGRQENHAPQGEDFVRRFLETLNLSPDVRQMIVKAVINHSRKEEVGTSLEELVKDADILDCYWYGDSITKEFHVKRLQKLLADLKLK